MARHLFDYPPAALRAWLVLVVCGALCIIWSLLQVLALPVSALSQVQFGIGLVVVAALFPVEIPRTRFHFGVSDLFIFALLALHGAPAATLAAGAEGLVAASRSSKRLTSRIGSPAAAATGMALNGLAFETLRNWLVALGLAPATAGLAALCLVAVPYFAVASLPLMGIIAIKNGQRLSLRDWFHNYSWLAALYLISAMVAGVLVMNAQQFGAFVMVVAAAVVAAVVALMHLSLRHHEHERQQQEARINEAEHEAALNQQRFTAAFTQAAIGMAIVRPDGRLQKANLALGRLLGVEATALVGRNFSALLHPGDAELFRRRVDSVALQGDEAFSIELRCRNGTDDDIWVSLHCGRYIDPADDSKGMIYQLHDITSRRLAEDRLQHSAHHDSLTDLANRSCFNERLTVAVDASARDPSKRFAVLFLDLDRFKVVNDSLGHHAGNALLREVARRLSDGVRPGDLVARLGGDEFAVLLERVETAAAGLALADRLLLTLQAPVVVNGTELQPGASVGITFSDLGYRTAEEVLRDADLAMYAAKARGRQRVVMFENSMHKRIAEKLALEGDLRRAIGEGQLSVVYQPLYELQPYRLSGFEALARWDHPERGPISPAVFIAIAEESGHIEALTQWVIDQAVGQLARWQVAHARCDLLDMHVNISGRDLANPMLVTKVRDSLQRHDLHARYLTLEITETTLMGQLETALDTLQTLRKMHVKFSIDDFGTGYSSLAYLSTLPIDSLKIDRSFVMGMSEQPQNVEIVRAVLDLGRSLGKTVIAEGIETLAQLATLKALGVHVGQGYLLSRPLKAEQVAALLEQQAVSEPV